jgi:hypothetical protein
LSKPTWAAHQAMAAAKATNSIRSRRENRMEVRRTVEIALETEFNCTKFKPRTPDALNAENTENAEGFRH